MSGPASCHRDREPRGRVMTPPLAGLGAKEKEGGGTKKERKGSRLFLQMLKSLPPCLGFTMEHDTLEMKSAQNFPRVFACN